MSNAVAAVALGSPTGVPSVGGILIGLYLGTALVSTQTVADDGTGTNASVSATFSNLAAGTYAINAQRLLADGSPSAVPAVSSAPFTVAQPFTATVPTSVTVTLA